jgi:hypothetical protein
VVRIGVLLDEDMGGAAAYADFERITGTAPAALRLQDGKFVWRRIEDDVVTYVSVDGVEVGAQRYSPFDISLAASIDAHSISMNLAVHDFRQPAAWRAVSNGDRHRYHRIVKSGKDRLKGERGRRDPKALESPQRLTISNESFHCGSMRRETLRTPCVAPTRPPKLLIHLDIPTRAARGIARI